jgi:transcription-repair coupling factor (superfamily II helicase)
MALYRRLNDAEDTREVEALSAEMIDRFGPLPSATENLIQLIQIKRQAIEAHIAKIDVGRAARWSRSTMTTSPIRRGCSPMSSASAG